MLFNSFAFAAFFAVVYAAYLLTMRRLTVQNLLLLVVSYFFYGCWDWRFLGLIAVSTLIDFVCGQALDRRLPERHSVPTTNRQRCYHHGPGARKLILAASVCVNLGILGLFKYYDFFVTSATALLEAIGISAHPRLLNVVLPVGISFYTFQTLSYTIDIYRGQLRAHKSLLEFAVFVAFFPQLVAGPIVRARDFLPQVSRTRRIELTDLYSGAYLVFWGLFKKVFIADNLAVLVDGVFNQDADPHGGAVLVAVYAFAVQIYCDFSGYTDVARGCAKMMGFDLPINFNLPYIATNPVEFWRRWHISLSTWLRDYLYIPLGGNRKGPRRMVFALMTTMLLGGLWHGAAWTFVLWGVFHGLLLVIYKQVGRAMPAFLSTSNVVRGADTSGRPHAIPLLALRWVKTGLFFHLVCLGWLLFRAESVEQVVHMLSLIATSFSVHGSGIVSLVTYSAPLLVMQWAQTHKNDLDALLRFPAPVRGLAYCAMFYALICFGSIENQPFIYFQF